MGGFGPGRGDLSGENSGNFRRRVAPAHVYRGVTSSDNHPEPSDDQLIREVLAGRRDAYAVLVRRHERHLHAAAWAILRDHHAAEDVTQETFIKAYGKLTTLRRGRSFGPWLLAIARRSATDRARSKSRRVLVAVPPETPTVEAPAEEDAALVIGALGRIPEREQQVLLLRYFDGLAVAGIAARLGCPVGTVTKRITRALGRLRDRIGELS
jgi:RNA polymerase sigma-70 factor, ECF subfamily